MDSIKIEKLEARMMIDTLTRDEIKLANQSMQLSAQRDSEGFDFKLLRKFKILSKRLKRISQAVDEMNTEYRMEWGKFP